MAVYIFFFTCLLSRQYIPVYTDDGKDSNMGEIIFPFFTLLQYLFLMGWLKVAEELMNPFGEDDDDFEINGMIDKNLKSSYQIVDEMHEDLPELLKDQYWDTQDIQIPYTEASLAHYKDPHVGSAEDMKIPEEKQFIVSLGPVAEEGNKPMGAFLRRISRVGDAPKDPESGNKKK